MLLHEIFRRPNNGTPVDVEYEYYQDGEDGEYHNVIIEMVVTSHSDPYSTGDSPTEYDAEPTGVAYFKDSRQPFDIKLVPEESWKWIDEQAIEKVSRGL